MAKLENFGSITLARSPPSNPSGCGPLATELFGPRAHRSGGDGKIAGHRESRVRGPVSMALERVAAARLRIRLGI